jgi:hypothetical protein
VAFEEACGSSFMIFSERLRGDDPDQDALSGAERPVLEMVLAGFHDAGISSVTVADELSSTGPTC